MTLICGIDPGTESPGFAVWCTHTGRFTYAAPVPPAFAVDLAVVESGWSHGAMGKVQMWGLGFKAARQLLSVQLNPGVDGAVQRYHLKPDAWRAALGLQANFPKHVCVGRLRLLRYRAYAQAATMWTDDVVEACGVAEGAALLMLQPLKKNRKGLVEVT